MQPPELFYVVSRSRLTLLRSSLAKMRTYFPEFFSDSISKAKLGRITNQLITIRLKVLCYKDVIYPQKIYHGISPLDKFEKLGNLIQYTVTGHEYGNLRSQQ